MARGGLAVAKYGGSILRDGRGFLEAARTTVRLLEEHEGVAVVVSAMKGVTDLLLEVVSAGEGWEERLKRIMGSYYTAAKEVLAGSSHVHRALSELSMLFDELLKLVWASKVVGDVTPYTVASIASFGEKLSASLLAAVLRSMGVEAVWFDPRSAGLVAYGDPLEAIVDYGESQRRVSERLGKLLAEGTVPVVAGFAAATREGKTVLLGRGGSDYTATLLARFLRAGRVYLFTDVDGLKTADPRIVPEARHVDVLGVEEATELAILGAKRMHPRTFEPLQDARVEVFITKPGAERATRIVPGEEGPPVKAVATVKGLAMVSVEGAGLTGRVGVAAAVMEEAARLGANIKVIAQPASETRIVVVVPSQKAGELERALRRRLGYLGVRVEARSVAAVSVVGYGLREPEIAGRAMARGLEAARALGAVWAPGSPSIVFLVHPDRTVEATRAVHREVVLPWWIG